MHLPWQLGYPTSIAGSAPLPGSELPAISTSVQPAEAHQLAGFARGADVLEIGAAYGYSAVVMALAGAHEVISVDPHNQVPDSERIMYGNLDAYGVADRVKIHRGTSQEILPELAEQHYRFDLVFIDGDHADAAVRHDVLAVVLPPLLAADGILACHDYGEDCCCPGVRTALDHLFPAGPDDLTGSLFVVRATPGKRMALTAQVAAASAEQGTLL